MNSQEKQTFEELSIEPKLSQTLAQRGIVTPTPIQSLVIPRILRGESIVVKSQTGSGKSIAYLLPLVQQLSSESDSKLLVLIPTRELAQQLGEECRRLTNLPLAILHGGVGYESQRELLNDNLRIIISTTGRLQDLIEQGVAQLKSIKYFVLDEADQMADMGFREPILELAKLRSDGAQTLCFSATMPDCVGEIVESLVGNFTLIESKDQPLAAQSITQSAYYVEQPLMDQLLIHLLRTLKPQRTIIFCRSRKMADNLCERLRAAEFKAEAIHSERSQAAREYILERFKGCETEILVATDLIARGIDVEGVSHVFNFGLPQNPEQYVHRIGRTGRAGNQGVAISLICPDESALLGATCAVMRQTIPTNTSHPYATPAITIALSGVKDRKKKRRK